MYITPFRVWGANCHVIPRNWMKKIPYSVNTNFYTVEVIDKIYKIYDSVHQYRPSMGQKKGTGISSSSSPITGQRSRFHFQMGTGCEQKGSLLYIARIYILWLNIQYLYIDISRYMHQTCLRIE